MIERSAEALRVLSRVGAPELGGLCFRNPRIHGTALVSWRVPKRALLRRPGGSPNPLGGRLLRLASAGTFGRVGARARAGVEVDQWLRVGPDGGQASSPAGWTDALPERGSERTNRLNTARRAESRDALARQRRGDWRKPSSMLAAASHGPQARRLARSVEADKQAMRRRHPVTGPNCTRAPKPEPSLPRLPFPEAGCSGPRGDERPCSCLQRGAERGGRTGSAGERRSPRPKAERTASQCRRPRSRRERSEQTSRLCGGGTL